MFIRIQQIRYSTNHLTGKSEWVNAGEGELINIDHAIYFSAYPGCVVPNVFHLQLTTGSVVCRSDDLAKMMSEKASEKASEKPVYDTVPQNPALTIEEFANKMMMFYQIHVTGINFSEAQDLYKIAHKTPGVFNPPKLSAIGKDTKYRLNTSAGLVIVGIKENK